MKFDMFLSKEEIKIHHNADMIFLGDLSCLELESFMKVVRRNGYHAVVGVIMDD